MALNVVDNNASIQRLQSFFYFCHVVAFFNAFKNIFERFYIYDNEPTRNSVSKEARLTPKQRSFTAPTPYTKIGGGIRDGEKTGLQTGRKTATEGSEVT